MRVKLNALALGIAIAAAGASQANAQSKVANPPPLFTVNDNSVSYAYRFNATDPFVTDHTGKSVVTFTHFDAWAYGTNFFNIDLLKSDINDPANPCGLNRFPARGCGGATRTQRFLRSHLHV